MTKPIIDPDEIRRRRACKCEACSVIRAALAKLDDIANRPAAMGYADINDLCTARRLLAEEVCASYSPSTERYE